MFTKKTILTLLFWVLTIVGSSCTNTSSATPMVVPSRTLIISPSSTVSPQPTLTETSTKTLIPSTRNATAGTPTETNSANLPITSTPIPTTTLRKPESGLIVTLGEKVESPWFPGVPVFSPDGKIIALATAQIRFWDVETHELTQQFNNPYPNDCYLSKAAFSPDGSLFAVSISRCWGQNSGQGYLLIWNFETGELLQEWVLELAHMVEPHQTPYQISVDAFTFIPGSSKIAYATGNQVVIRDVLDQSQPPIELSLGSDMFASELSIRDDGRFLFVLMNWDKTNTWPAAWSEQFKVQIWQLETETISRVIDYPEIGYGDEFMSLHGDVLLHQDWINGTFEVHNLSTDEIDSLPYRRGWKYFNADLSLMISARLFGYDADEQIIELWDTDRWRNIYSFLPDFGRDWIYGMHDIAFSPDSTLLAIEHQEQVSLWNIQPIVQP
jgi:WD40 repeat protein